MPCSPIRVLRSGALALLVTAATAAPAAADLSVPGLPDATQWTVQGSVNANVDSIVVRGDRTIIGGRFNYLGPPTGHGFAADPATGDRRAGGPLFDDDIQAAVPDGSGGAYVAGNFSAAAGGRPFLLRLRADGSVEPSFAPAPDAAVSRLAVGAGKLYVAGTFTTIGGQARPRLARLDPATGAADAWNPAPNSSVTDLAVASDGTAYVAGFFSQIGGAAHGSVAKIAPNGSVTLGWDTNDDATTLAVSGDGNLLYVSGYFTGIRIHTTPAPVFVTTDGTARVSTTSGAVAGWRAAPVGGRITDMTVAGGDLLVAGDFTTIGSGAVPRRGFARIDGQGTTTATVRSWNPAPTGALSAAETAPRGTTIALAGDGTVLLGGSFLTIGGVARHGAARVDDLVGLPMAWDPDLSDPANAVVPLGSGDVFVGGEFVAARGVLRHDVAVLDATGVPTTFNAALEGDSRGVHALALSPDGQTLWAGGDFASVGGTASRGLAALDATTGALRPTAAAVAGGVAEVHALALPPDGSRLFVAGDFTTLSGAARPRLGAVATATGAATAFAPNPDQEVDALTLSRDGATLYAGGYFTKLGAQAVQPLRARIGAMSTATGDATAFNPGSNGNVTALALTADDATLYLGGDFVTTVAGQPRKDAAAVSTATGAATAFRPDADRDVRAVALAPDGATVLLGGFFDNAGGQPRNQFAEVDAATGLARPRTLTFARNGSVRAIVAQHRAEGDALWIGGGLAFGAPSAVSAFAQFRTLPPAAPGGGGDPTTPTAPGPGPVVLDRTPPIISGLTVTNKRFRVGAKATAVTAAAKRGRAPVGTQLRFRLSEASRVTIAFTRSVRGHRTGRRCVAGTGKRGAKRCTLVRKGGTLTRSLPAGTARVLFSGRVGRKALTAATWTATLLATDAAGNRSKPRTVRLTVVRY
jgi:hypothetical protein